MGVHCYLTELGALVTMAAKIVAVVAALATVVAGEPGYGYGGVAYHSYGGSSYTHRSPQGLHGGYGYYGYGKRSAEAEPGYGYGHGYGAASVYVSQADHGYGYNPPSTPMDTTLDMDMARGPLMPSLDMVMAML